MHEVVTLADDKYVTINFLAETCSTSIRLHLTEPHAILACTTSIPLAFSHNDYMQLLALTL